MTFGDLWRVLGGLDTVRDHQGLTLRSKGTIMASRDLGCFRDVEIRSPADGEFYFTSILYISSKYPTRLPIND